MQIEISPENLMVILRSLDIAEAVLNITDVNQPAMADHVGALRDQLADYLPASFDVIR